MEFRHRRKVDPSQSTAHDLSGFASGRSDRIGRLRGAIARPRRSGIFTALHRLDLVLSIVEHYAPADVMPEPFAQARMMVQARRTAAVQRAEIRIGILTTAPACHSVVMRLLNFAWLQLAAS